MKVTNNTPVVTPAQARPAPVAAPRKQTPASESARPVAQTPRPAQASPPVESPLKKERTAASTAETVRAQHIQPSPDVPPPVETKRADLSFGSHPQNNANPGTRAYASMQATAKVTGKGSRVDNSA